MKKLSLTTLVAAVVFGAMGSPGYVAASDCCPGGGGLLPRRPVLTGQQLFVAPYSYSQPNPAWTGNYPQGTGVTNVAPAPNKTQATQTSVQPVVLAACQAAGRPAKPRVGLWSPLQETLW